jgi:hypothetical protein
VTISARSSICATMRSTPPIAASHPWPPNARRRRHLDGFR